MNEHDFDGDRPRQLLVCTTGVDCARALKARDGLSTGLADALKAARTAAAFNRELYVIKTGCQGWCEQSPVVQLLPEGRVFHAPSIADADKAVHACLDGGSKMQDQLIWDYSQTRAQNEARRKA